MTSSQLIFSGCSQSMSRVGSFRFSARHSTRISSTAMPCFTNCCSIKMYSLRFPIYTSIKSDTFHVRMPLDDTESREKCSSFFQLVIFSSGDGLSSSKGTESEQRCLTQSMRISSIFTSVASDKCSWPDITHWVRTWL